VAKEREAKLFQRSDHSCSSTQGL